METLRKPIVTGREGGPIKLDVAASWTKNYRDKNPGQTISQFFGKEILETILKQEGCLGIRFYYANDHAGKKHLIIVGVRHDGSDQTNEEYCDHEERHHFPLTAAAMAKVGGTAPVVYDVADQSTPCPGSPGCPKGALTGNPIA